MQLFFWMDSVCRIVKKKKKKVTSEHRLPLFTVLDGQQFDEAAGVAVPWGLCVTKGFQNTIYLQNSAKIRTGQQSFEMSFKMDFREKQNASEKKKEICRIMASVYRK